MQDGDFFTYNDIVLQKYKDYSRKIVAQRKLNQNAILAKACPTSKACVKFLINTQLELNVELIPALINVLRNERKTVCYSSFIANSEKCF